MSDWQFTRAAVPRLGPVLFAAVLLAGGGQVMVGQVEAADAAGSSTVPHFNVRGYAVDGSPMLSTNVLFTVFSKYSGTNVSLEEITEAAADLQTAYRRE